MEVEIEKLFKELNLQLHITMSQMLLFPLVYLTQVMDLMPIFMFMQKILMLMDLIWFLILSRTQKFIPVELYGLLKQNVDQSIRKYISLIFL